MRSALRALAMLALGAALAAASALPGRAGMTALYPFLGVFPGLALAIPLRRGTRPAAALVRALALGPLVSAAAGALLLAAGWDPRGAALAIAAAGFLGATAAVAWPGAFGTGDREFADPRVLAVAAALVTISITPPLFNPWISMRLDGWTHGGIAMEILERGIPPQDPRFAGLRLNYVWFFNLFLALLSSVRGDEPFWFGSLFNAGVSICLVAFAAAAAFALWRSRRAAFSAAVLLCVGLNAGMWMLWPLTWVRALTGEVRGLRAIRELASEWEIGHCGILYSLDAPLAGMVSFLDKVLIGTAVGYAYVWMLVYLWALVSWWRGEVRSAWVWLALASAGMLFFHSVVGLSVIPVAIAALAIVWVARMRAPWLPAPARLAGPAAITLAGAAVTAPYTLAITRGWDPAASGQRLNSLGFDLMTPWTILTACAVVIALAARPVREAWSRRRPAHAALVLYAAVLLGFALVVKLTENNQRKFVFELFVPLVLLAAPAFARWTLALRRRGAAVLALVFGLLFAVPVLLTWQGYLFDPEGRTARALHPAADDDALAAWIRERTPRDAIIVDGRFRDLLMVKARRRLYYGSTFGPERAAFPRAQVIERRAVLADLYGDARDLDRATRAFDSLGAPVFVLYRAEDETGGAAPWRALERRPDRWELAYRSPEARLYRLKPGGAS